ncbi:MAG TPA: hypothetical protein VM581_04200 [Magnetospirillaceae bacterium]|nr:hypothetical protein [Magnetospirillaceae bacterium]
MAFEVFKEIGIRQQEFISITETKSFGLSRPFIDKYKITKDHKAVILYDPETKRVALHFSTNGPKFGLAVRIPNAKHGATIVARSFFDTKGIDARRYSGRYDEFSILSLNELGVDKEGVAYVLQLRENKSIIKSESVMPDDAPINLADIPF